MLRIYLVRHGATVWNEEGRIQGHSDIPLSSDGVRQASRLAERLREAPLSAVWSSDLQRALCTAEAIAAPHGLAVRATPLLRERMLGEWEGLTQAQIRARGERPVVTASRQDTVGEMPPGSEPMAEVWSRLLEARRAAVEASPDGEIALVGHGGSLRAILADTLGAGIEGMRRLWLDNASLSLIEHEGDRAWVRFANDTGHLRA
ncbi:MAG TPA: histidine phosphatase family protein [Chthonomonadales bacterium]|nr:histidine phosphatase family protein [Chthonomonadales bacterium]